MRIDTTSWRRWIGRLTLAASVAAVTGAGTATAYGAQKQSAQSSGYVDGSMFADLADDDEMVIEVSIRGPLLRMVSTAIASEDEQLGDFIADITSISAVVVDVDANEKSVAKMIKAMVSEMEDDGWERLARVREESTNVVVYALFAKDGDTLSGLTVVVTESDENKLVFANIAGKINLQLVGALGKKLGMPGLSELTGGHWKPMEKHAKKKKRR